MQAASAAAAAAAPAVDALGKPVACPVQMRLSCVPLVNPRKPDYSRGRDLAAGLQLPVSVLVAAAYWTSASTCRACRKQDQRKSAVPIRVFDQTTNSDVGLNGERCFHYTEADASRGMQQRWHLERARRLPSETSMRTLDAVKHPIHWTESHTSVLRLAICAHFFLTICTGLSGGHTDLHTVLYALSDLVSLRLLRKLRD